LKLGVVYFLLVLGAGFILGTVRVLLMVPSVGDRAAELLEMPLMVLATVLAAWWITQRFPEPSDNARRLVIGGIPLSLMLTAELTVDIGLRGMTTADVILN